MTEIGDRAQKIEAIPFPGEIRAIFTTRAGQVRYVVEATGTAVTDEMVRRVTDRIISAANLPEQQASRLARHILESEVELGQYAGMLHIFSGKQLGIEEEDPCQ